MFDFVGLYSAAIRIPGEENNPAYADLEGKLKTQFDKQPAFYWIAIGKDDFLYNDNVRFRELLDKNNLPYILSRVMEDTSGAIGATISPNLPLSYSNDY